MLCIQKVTKSRVAKIMAWLCMVFVLFIVVPQAHAGCQCVASDSAAINETKGTWQSFEDGGPLCDTVGPTKEGVACEPYKQGYINTPFCVPTPAELLANIVRILFFVAGLVAIIMLLLGGFEWLSSAGDEKKLAGARARMLAAMIGLVVMVAVMTLIIVIEQVIFGGKVCLGVSCPLDMRRFVIVGDGSSYSGRPPCFGGAAQTQSTQPQSRITGTASGAGSLHTVTTTPSPSRAISPSPKKRILIITATPGLSNTLSNPPAIPGSRVTIVPYGSMPTATPSGYILPGTGGGGKGPRPTVPPL